MNPRIGKRSKYNKQDEKPRSKTVLYIELNTKKNITIKQEYLYLEDVKNALNIHHYELRIILFRWIVSQMKKNADPKKLIDLLEQMSDQDRHQLQKRYRITL
jgi:hypothetical protein